MVIAALVSFGTLLVAWVLAPDRHEVVRERPRVEPEAEPLAA